MRGLRLGRAGVRGSRLFIDFNTQQLKRNIGAWDATYGTIMTTETKKEIMHGCFMHMMFNGYFDNQVKMAIALNSIIHILGEAFKLSKQEQDECLVYFFNEYSTGCSSPISESTIRNTLIPNVRNIGTIDLRMGTEILDNVFDKLHTL